MIRKNRQNILQQMGLYSIITTIWTHRFVLTAGFAVQSYLILSINKSSVGIDKVPAKGRRPTGLCLCVVSELQILLHLPVFRWYRQVIKTKEGMLTNWNGDVKKSEMGMLTNGSIIPTIWAHCIVLTARLPVQISLAILS